MIGVAIGVIAGLSIIGGLAGLAQAKNEEEERKRSGKYGPSSTAAFFPIAPTVAQVDASKLSRLESLLKTLVSSTPSLATPGIVVETQRLATEVGLTKTAAALVTGSLPTDERWPGTTLSVFEYIRSKF
jgi:hypothetical protein